MTSCWIDSVFSPCPISDQSRIKLVEELSWKHSSVKAFVKRSSSLDDKELVLITHNITSLTLFSSTWTFFITPSLSADFRYKGSGFCRKKLFATAILHFNESILSGEGESLSLCYVNRSVAFSDTGDWLHSLRDIQTGLDSLYLSWTVIRKLWLVSKVISRKCVLKCETRRIRYWRYPCYVQNGSK